MSVGELSRPQLVAARESGAAVLIRLFVGLIFAGEGMLTFVRPESLGPGRFDTAGIAAGAFPAYLDGVFEIGCGSLILVGLFTRLATLPMIVDMLGALGITEVPLRWGHPPLCPKEGGWWDFLHEGRLEIAILRGSVLLLIAVAGALSHGARLNPDRAPAVVT